MVAPGWAIGIDVGGTKIAGGVVRFPEGVVEVRALVPTRPERGPDAVLADVVDLATRLRQQAEGAGRHVEGLGLGVPELVSPQGRVTSAQTIDWRDVPLAERLAGFGPVRVEADVRAAALAEARFGAGRNVRLFVYVTVGTGISSTLVQDGLPFAGARGNALVLASGTWEAGCERCGSPVRVVLEEAASGPALVRRYRQARPGWSGDAADVMAAAAAGEPEAAHVARTAGEALGNGVAFLVNVLDPEVVVVGGGLGLAGGPYRDAFERSLREHVWAEVSRDVPVVPAALGTDAGVVGAAALAWDAIRGVRSR